jgi:hypothetical protein
MSEHIPYNTYNHNFGILIPDDTGVSFTHQSGGMSCTQIDLEGVFLPLEPPKMRFDSPKWFSEVDKDISEIDLNDEHIPNKDFESFPEWVQERGHFYNYNEYFYWLRQDHVDWYGNLDLIKEQRLWNYDPDGDLHEEVRDYNPAEKWDSLEDIWNEINLRLSFEYEGFDAWQYKRDIASNPDNDIEYEDVETPLPNGYPEYGAAFKWIKITGSKRDNQGRIRSEWAEKLSGEYVLMTFDNCD